MFASNAGYDRDAYNVNSGIGYEYDFFSGLDVGTSAIDLNTDTVLSGTLGALSFSNIQQLTISETVTSLSGDSGLTSQNTLDSINTIYDNILRMEARFNSATNRLESEFNRLQIEKEAKLDSKVFLDDKLVADTYFNPYAIENQFNNPYNAVDLLP